MQYNEVLNDPRFYKKYCMRVYRLKIFTIRVEIK